MAPSQKAPAQAPADKQFAFILVSDENQAASQKVVRAHAMRESIRQRKAGLGEAKPSESAPIPYRTGRFRLSASTTKAKSGTKSKVQSPQLLEPQTTISRQPSPDESEDSEDLEVALDARYGAHVNFQSVPSAGWLEPFNVMPITLGIRQQKLLYYCEFSIE